MNFVEFGWSWWTTEFSNKLTIRIFVNQYVIFNFRVSFKRRTSSISFLYSNRLKECSRILLEIAYKLCENSLLINKIYGKVLVTPEELQLKMRSKKDLYFIFKFQGEYCNRYLIVSLYLYYCLILLIHD